MKSLVLCSGGVKSTFLAVEASKEGESVLLFLKHGQLNQFMEEEAVARTAAFCHSPLLKVELAGFPPTKEHLLQFLCFFWHAAPVAIATQCNVIYYGLGRKELYRWGKTAEEFVKGLQSLLNLALPWYDTTGRFLGDIIIETPLRKLTLKHILRLGNEWRIPWEDTWSCEKGNQVWQCGCCSKCLARKRAFKEEGSEDLTVYRLFE